MRLYCFLLALVLFQPFTRGQAQDVHYSQFYHVPVLANPANSGFFEGKYRAGINYRNQWNSITTPYTTLLAGGDMKVIRKRAGRDFAGAGIYIIRDKAGDGGYGVSEAALSLSWFHSLERRKNHYIGAGLMVAAVENSVDFNKLRFPDQYDGSGYNPGIVHGESLGKEWDYYLDLGAGITWNLSRKTGEQYSAGLSLFHPHRPKRGLLEASHGALPPRWSIQAAYTRVLDEEWTLTPSLIYNRQGRQRELLIGSMVHYTSRHKNAFNAALLAGAYTRWNDAAILMAGVETGSMTYALSYDINYSGLRKASYLRGGLELAILYTFLKPEGFLKREVTCPIF